MSVMGAGTSAGAMRTVEGRLTMADFRRGARRCYIEAASGEPIPCVFDATQDDLIVSALMRDVRVTGEYVRSRRKMPDLRITGIAATGGRRLVRQLPRMPERYDIEELAAQQGTQVISDIDQLRGDFWPEDESVDDFIAHVRKWRDAG